MTVTSDPVTLYMFPKTKDRKHDGDKLKIEETLIEDEVRQ